MSNPFSKKFDSTPVPFSRSFGGTGVAFSYGSGGPKWFARFDGENNYISFDKTTIIPDGEAGEISFTCVLEKDSFWIICFKDTTSSVASDRLLIKDKVIYVESTVVGYLRTTAFDMMTDGRPHKVRIGRSSTGYWYMYIDDIPAMSITSDASTSEISVNAFGIPYQGATEVPYIQGWIWDLDFNSVIKAPLSEGYTEDGYLTRGTKGVNLKYEGFEESDFAESIQITTELLTSKTVNTDKEVITHTTYTR